MFRGDKHVDTYSIRKKNSSLTRKPLCLNSSNPHQRTYTLQTIVIEGRTIPLGQLPDSIAIYFDKKVSIFIRHTNTRMFLFLLQIIQLKFQINKAQLPSPLFSSLSIGLNIEFCVFNLVSLQFIQLKT